MKFSRFNIQFFSLLAAFLTLAIPSVGKTQKTALNQLTKIQDGLFQNPVKAKQDLMEFIQKHPESTDSIKGLAYNSLSVTMGMTNQLDSGIWAAQEAIRLLPDNSIVKAGALKTIAILCRLKGDWKKAEEAIQLSMALNDSIWKDSHMKVLTMQEYASLCLDQNDYHKATKIYLDALKISQSADFKYPNKDFILAKLRINLAEAYMRCENYPFAIREFNSALPVLDSLKDFDGLVRAGVNLTEAYIQSGKINTADSLLTALIPVCKQLQNEELESYLMFKTADTRSAAKEFSKALPYYRSAFKSMDENNSPIIVDCAIAYLKALEKTGNYADALQVLENSTLKKALESALISDRLSFKKTALPFIWNTLSTKEFYRFTKDLLSLEDSAAAERDKKSATQLQAQYQFERQQEMEELLRRENEILKEEERFKKKQLYFTISIAALALTILGLLFLRLRQRSLEKDRVLKSNQQELQFQKERREWAEKEKDLRDLLIHQQKAELMRSIDDAEELRHKLEQLVTEQQAERRKELLNQFETSKAEKRGMESLLSQFNAVYPTFMSSLLKRYPALSQSDLQFCTMIRMNLSTKEISSLFNIEQRSVYARKYRIMKKIGLNEDDNLESVLFAIE